MNTKIANSHSTRMMHAVEGFDDARFDVRYGTSSAAFRDISCQVCGYRKGREEESRLDRMHKRLMERSTLYSDYATGSVRGTAFGASSRASQVLAGLIYSLVAFAALYIAI